MIWINRFFLFMSLSGSIALLLYYLVKALFGRYLSASARYLLLKICMCFYLLPLPLLSEEIRVKIRMLYPGFSYGIEPLDVWITDFSSIIYDTPNGYIFPGFSEFILLLMGIWLVIAAGILIVQYRNYRKIKQLTKYLPKASGQLADISQQIQNEIHLRKKIITYTLDEDFTPFCYGLFHPRIMIPAEYEETEAQIFLRHELQHIKSHDFFTRITALLIVTLHFFNPFAYLLSYEIGKASEMACDEKILKSASEKQRNRYGELLLRVSCSSPFLTYTNSFSGNNKKTMKERIFMMKHPRKTKTAVLLCSVLLIGLFSTLPAAAYELPHVEYSVSPASSSYDDGSAYMLSLENNNPYADPNEVHFCSYDTFFLDENGNVIPLENELVAPQSSCAHTYVSGYMYEHIKKGNGCTYTVYSIKRCSKCGAIKDKTYISTTNYAVCPHK